MFKVGDKFKFYNKDIIYIYGTSQIRTITNIAYSISAPEKFYYFKRGEGLIVNLIEKDFLALEPKLIKEIRSYPTWL